MRAQCPLYKRETSNMICCSGISKENFLHLAFSNKSNKVEHKKSYCERRYRMCPLYQMLIAQEEREGS